MAREGRGLFVSMFKDFINSLKPRQLRGKLIGKDYYGNQYYEIPSNRGRPSRYFVPEGGDVSKFDQGLPAEWESWLRFRRKLAPTDEEVEKNLALMKMRKENALKIEEKFKPKEIQQPALDKSFPNYDDYEVYPGKKSDDKR